MFVIFGATGNTGHIVAETLLLAGKRVRAVGRSADKLKPLVDHGAEGFMGSIEDPDAVTRAMSGAQAVYVMIPGNPSEPDPEAYDERVSEAAAQAIERNQVPYVVLLSSVGAELTEGTGPVVGLHRMEARLNEISHANVLSLRPNYFMDNVLFTAGMIKQMGINGGVVSPDKAFNQVATKDIGSHAADRLLKLDFSGKHYQDFAGPEDVTQSRVTSAVGKAIGKPDLPYIQFPPADVKNALVGMGTSERVASRLVEMYEAINADTMKSTQRPPQLAKGTTTIEQFAAEHAAAFR